MASAKLVNCGSLCIDYVYRVPRIAAAGQTIASVASDVYPGGKGLNQSIAAARAGATVHHVGAVGADGDGLLEALQREGVDVSAVATRKGASGHAVIQVDDLGHNAIVIDGGANRDLSTEDFSEALTRAQPGDWLLLQNETNDVDMLLRDAAAQNVSVAMNLAPFDARARNYPLELLSLLIVNEDEAAGLSSCTDAQDSLTHLSRLYPRVSIVLTLGNRGLLYTQSGTETVRTLSAYAVDAVDETAAGDAFVGYLLADLIAGRDLTSALVRASAAGALATTQQGAAPSVPQARAVHELMSAQSLSRD